MVITGAFTPSGAAKAVTADSGNEAAADLGYEAVTGDLTCTSVVGELGLSSKGATDLRSEI